MLNEFTFVVITYNHEKYIEEHLNSILEIIHTYGFNISCDLVICDDASNDHTLEVIKKWIALNGKSFRDVYFSLHDDNEGTVRNLIDGIRITKTKDFKFLAGDDKYVLLDLFSVYDNLDGKIGISKVLPFGDYTLKQYRSAVNNYNICKCLKSAKKIGTVLNIKNIIIAPGVFIPGELIKCEEFYDYMSAYVYIEDYPMWQYLINKKRTGIKILNKKYVFYRYGNGISTSKQGKNDKYIDERNQIYKKYKTKMYIMPKAINPYAYYYFFLYVYCKIFSLREILNE